MSDQLLKEYVAAWLRHTMVSDTADGRENLAAFLTFLAPDVVYEDIPSGSRHEGRDAVAAMCRSVSGMFEMKIDIASEQSDGERFAFEFECVATLRQTGDVVTFRAGAIGTFRDGKVASHRDYYDFGAFGRPE